MCVNPFGCQAPYGYRNIRKDGRGLVEIDPAPADNVRRMFELFAFEPLTLDTLVDKMNAEGRKFRENMPLFPRSSVHNILLDRAYIGEIEYKGQWYQWVVGNKSPVDSVSVIQEAEAFASAIAAGNKVKVDYNEMRDAAVDQEDAPPADLENEIDA